MPCKKENCKCFKCGKIADKEVDTKLLSNSSTSDLKPELASENEVKPISNVSSASKSSFVVYKQEYSNISNHKTGGVDEENLDNINSAENIKENFANKQSSIELLTKFERRLQDHETSPQRPTTKVESREIEIQVKTDLVDGKTSPINLTNLSPSIHEDPGILSNGNTTDLSPVPPVCSGQKQSHDIGVKDNSEGPPLEDDVPIRKFSISMREDVDKPLHPLQHHESNKDLPVVQDPMHVTLSSDEEDYDRSQKGYVQNTDELKKILQLIVDASDKILNTIDKAGEKSSNNMKSDNDFKKGDRDNGDKGKSNSPYIYNIHNIQLDSPNPIAINLPLHLHFDKGKIKMIPTKPIQVKARPFINNIKTSSESVNIHYPKTPYKTLSSEFVITENVLVNGYTDGIPNIENKMSDDIFRKMSNDQIDSLNNRQDSQRPTIILNKNQISDLDVINQHRRQSFKDSEVLSDKVNLKLPVNFPQQRNIKVCVPCYCDTCPLFDNDGNLICPEQCGCCTCAYTINEANPDDRTELELCRCTSKTQFNTIGRSYVSRCQCSRRVDLCPCRDKYGTLGEQVAEFDDDTSRDIKRRKSTRKSTLRMSRLSKPLLEYTDDSAKNENTTTTTTTPTTDDTGRRADDETDRGRLSTKKR